MIKLKRKKKFLFSLRSQLDESSEGWGWGSFLQRGRLWGAEQGVVQARRHRRHRHPHIYRPHLKHGSLPNLPPPYVVFFISGHLTMATRWLEMLILRIVNMSPHGHYMCTNITKLKRLHICVDVITKPGKSTILTAIYKLSINL